MSGDLTFGSPRRRAEVVMTVTVDDQKQTFSVDTTTTGDPYTAAAQILGAVRLDAEDWVQSLSGDGFAGAES